MLQYVKLYLLTIPVFFAMDFVWIWFVANPMYQKHIPGLLKPKPELGVALAFYLIYIACTLALVSVPAATAGSVQQAILMGAVLGIAAYGTYDLTNWSVLKDWTWYVSLPDWAWGTFLTSATATAGFYIARWLGIGAS